MRPGRLAAWVGAACAAAPAQGKDLLVDDSERACARLGLQVRAKKVVRRGKPLLLIRIDPTAVRTVARADGGTESASLADRGIAFLPVRVACDRARVQASGEAAAPHAASPCVDTAMLAHSRALPAFIAFPYPAARAVRVTVPVTVQAPAPPIATTLRSMSSAGRRVDVALVGEYAPSVRVQIE